MVSCHRSLISHFSHPLDRLAAVDSVGNFAATYTWDANGNLLDDKQAEVAFSDNGLGGRAQQSEAAQAIPATRSGGRGWRARRALRTAEIYTQLAVGFPKPAGKLTEP